MRDDVLILCYHAVSEHWDAALATTEPVLLAAIDRMYEGTDYET